VLLLLLLVLVLVVLLLLWVKVGDGGGSGWCCRSRCVHDLIRRRCGCAEGGHRKADRLAQVDRARVSLGRMHGLPEGRLPGEHLLLMWIVEGSSDACGTASKEGEPTVLWKRLPLDRAVAAQDDDLPFERALVAVDRQLRHPHRVGALICRHAHAVGGVPCSKLRRRTDEEGRVAPPRLDAHLERHVHLLCNGRGRRRRSHDSHLGLRSAGMGR